MNFAEMTVDEFSTPSPLSVDHNEKLPAAWQMMKDRNIRHLVIQDEQEFPVGILSHRDLVTFSQAKNFEEIRVKDIMSEKIYTVVSGTKLYSVALTMSEKKIGSALVINADSGELAIFTATDALNALVEILRGDRDDPLQQVG